jgi:glucose-6-phosphate 1-dehydrogenase
VVSPDEEPAVIGRLVLFGASGDLVGRYLLPALAALHEAGQLPDGFRIVGAARESWDDDGFRRHAAERLEEHAADVAPATREALTRSLRYHQVDLEDADSVSDVLRAARDGEGADPVAAYLALPQGMFAPTLRSLAAAELPPGSRIAVEKPFGEDLDGAVALNALLTELFGDDAERTVFRVDHALGMATVHNALAMRLANRVIDVLWSGTHIEQIDVLWEEDLALEGRAGYYDRAGALKDVMQNHMLQVLCVLAMEPPATLGERDLHDAKADALRALRPPDLDEAASLTRRARYSAGRAGGRSVPSYADEEGVDPGRRTETFAEVILRSESERWKGTRFVLRAGKALGRQRKEAVIRFRPVELPTPGVDAAPGELRIGIDDPFDLALRLTGGTPDETLAPAPLELAGDPPPSALPPYARVLLDILSGGSSLSVRADAAEESWRVVMPVLTAWANDLVPLEEYPAGSAGPSR